MWNKKFWFNTAERAIKTAAQTTLSILVIDEWLVGLDWQATAVGIATATLASVLTSIVSTKVAEPDSPSLLR